MKEKNENPWETKWKCTQNENCLKYGNICMKNKVIKNILKQVSIVSPN